MKHICPRCNQEMGVPIVLGFPSSETAAHSFRGKVYLCGCYFDSKKAELHCFNCHYEWNKHESSNGLLEIIPNSLLKG